MVGPRDAGCKSGRCFDDDGEDGVLASWGVFGEERGFAADSRSRVVFRAVLDGRSSVGTDFGLREGL